MITFNNPAIYRLQAGSTPGGLRVSSPGLAGSALDMFELPRMDLGKRHREADDDLDDGSLATDDGHELRLREKGKTKVATTVGVLKVAGSTNRTDRKPAVKALTRINPTSKAVGYRAGVLMTPSAHRGSNQLLHVPSVQQESTAIATQESPSVEGGTQGATRSQSNSIVQEEAEVFSMENGTSEETKDNVFHIPKRLKEDYRLFLEATSKEFEQGTLHVVKCKLCPGVTFKTWDHFTRHCKTAELHPLKLLFCDHCGDFFARRDSLRRHSNNRASECDDISQQEAEGKRNETRAIHRVFLNNTKAYLETNEGTWTPFAQVIKKKYPNSSKRLKRGIGHQSRLQAA
jgi:hypothetical protein